MEPKSYTYRYLQSPLIVCIYFSSISFQVWSKIATYVEQRFDKKLVTDANNHLDPLECVDIKCRRYVRPDSRVTDQSDIPFPKLGKLSFTF